MLAGLVLALAPTAQAAPIVIPGDGYTGPYRIAFVTNGTRNAESPTIDDYNSFVTTAAGLITELDDLNATWKVIGSTAAVSARANTGTYTLALDGAGLYDSASDVPIYTTNGLRMADNNADLWDGSIATPVFFGDGTVAGVEGGAQEQTWTGSQPSGDSRPPVVDGTALGDSGLEVPGNYNYVQLVRGGFTNGAWVGAAAGAASDWSYQTKHLMAMSGVIPGVPVVTSTLAITSITSVGGGVFELTFKGEVSTSYQFSSSPILDFDPGDLVTGLSATVGDITGGSSEVVTTDGSGDATVQMTLGGPANFVRAVVLP